MTFFKYFKDHVYYILTTIVLFIGTLLFMMIYPFMTLRWDFVFSLFLLLFFFTMFFLVIGYLRKRDYYKDLEKAKVEVEGKMLAESVQTQEGKFIVSVVNELKEAQQENLQTLILKQQDQEDFLNQWVHNIKVPIAALGLIKESIEDDIPDVRYFQMEMEMDKIEQNVEQVLYYARLDSFSKDYLIEEFSSKEVVQKSLKTFANYFILKHLKVHLSGEDFAIASDEKWLRYAIEQVISNAVKYTPENGEISILLQSTKDKNVIVVKDNGYGIPKEDLPRIFEKGFTGSRGRTDEKSTGFGLYLAKNLMEKLGHQLEVTSLLGEGTEVAFIFGKETTFFSEENFQKI